MQEGEELRHRAREQEGKRAEGGLGEGGERIDTAGAGK